MAPDHIADVMTQRLRWAMGALQILMRDNPLRLVSAWAGWTWGWCVRTAGAETEAGQDCRQVGACTAPHKLPQSSKDFLHCQSLAPRVLPAHYLPQTARLEPGSHAIAWRRTTQVGLTTTQSLLYFEAAAHHYLALTTVFMAVVPVIYLFTQISPLVSWQLAAGSAGGPAQQAAGLLMPCCWGPVSHMPP